MCRHTEDVLERISFADGVIVGHSELARPPEKDDKKFNEFMFRSTVGDGSLVGGLVVSQFRDRRVESP